MTDVKKADLSTEFLKDLFGFLDSIKDPVKDAKNPFFNSKYAPLNAVLPELKEQAKKFNFRIMQHVTGGNGEVAVQTVLLHITGQYVTSGVLSMPIMREQIKDKQGNIVGDKMTPQSLGSTVTYLRRYQGYPFFGMAEVDDDGNAGSHRDREESEGKGKAEKKKAKQAEPEEPEYSDGLERIEFYEKEIAAAKKVDNLNEIWEEIKADDSIDADGEAILKSALKNRKKVLTEK